MLKVVIIDANSISRNLLTTVLTNGGHEVIGDSNTSLAGQARMIKLKPQVVCIDLAGSENGGMDMLDAIREALPRSLIFVVSNKIDATTIEQSMQRGVSGFIVKPFKSLTVLTTIRNGVLKVARSQRAKVEE